VNGLAKRSRFRDNREKQLLHFERDYLENGWV
jgi:hypothetical protein